MSEVTAILGPHGSKVADYFFHSMAMESSALVSELILAAQALVFEEFVNLDLGHSLTMWPFDPHKRQSP